MNIAHRNKVLLVLMLYHSRQEIVYTTSLTKEDFAFTILHIFLDIECNGFCDTEVFHVLGDVYSQLLGHVEEMVDGMT